MLASLLVVFLSVGVYLIVRYLPISLLLEAGDWLRGHGGWGVCLFGCGFIVAGLLLVPASWMTILAGAIFGIGLGFAVSSIAAAIAAGIAFLLSRSFLRHRIANRLQPRAHYRALDRTVAQHGWKILALMRLSPAIPYGLENYAFGLTAMRFRTYLLTTWMAMLPTSLVYASVGWAGGEGLAMATGEGRGRTPLEIVLLAIGVLATVAVTVYVTVLTRRALRVEVTEERDS